MAVSNNMVLEPVQQSPNSTEVPLQFNHPSSAGTSDFYSSGPGAFMDGDMPEEEDEEVVEVLLDDGEVQQAGQLTILSRYYSLRVPNQAVLFEDMRRAWRLRADMSIKSLRDNMFIVTFNSEGDYNFVLQGGPWLHRGDALLVAKFDGITSPSQVPLDCVPVWVRVYDLPLVLMTKKRGELYGSKLGRVREVDVDEEGRNKHDFFRIRVDLPVKKPLKPTLAIKINMQGSEVVRRFELRYERVPFFCFICGYIGHSDKDCEKRVANIDHPCRFSSDLRCSPLKPFERKLSTIRGQQKTSVACNLSFRGAGSASSSSAKQQKGSSREDIIPDRVDAHDGFDGRENAGDGAIDEQLANQANNLTVSGDTTDQRTGQYGRDKVQQSQQSDSVAHTDDEMIQAIQQLQHPASFGGDTSDDLSESNRKRTPSHNISKLSERVQQALVVYEKDAGIKQVMAAEGKEPGRALKRSRKTEVEATLGEAEATSPGATGKLTGPVLRARQEK